MTLDVRPLTGKAELRHAARAFRTAMVGLPPLGHYGPCLDVAFGQIGAERAA